jgi:hypothetical protein
MSASLNQELNGWRYSVGKFGRVSAVDPQGRSHSFRNWSAFWNATGAGARPTGDVLSFSSSSDGTSLRNIGAGVLDEKWNPRLLWAIGIGSLILVVATGGLGIFVVAYVALCYLVGQYAKREKGRDPTAWALYAALLSVVGAFLILLCLPKRELPAPAPAPQAAGLWQWHKDEA